MVGDEDSKSPPKLFGVPLHGKKRVNPTTWDDRSTVTYENSNSNLSLSMHPPSKIIKMDLDFNLIPSSDAPIEKTPTDFCLKFG